jgi:hypothetical protein
VVKLNLGSGKQKMEGFLNVDSVAFEGVDIVHDLRVTPWPWENDNVEQVHCSHFLEHLAGEERVSFFNELFRVMKKGAQAQIITPHWSHDCAYGDPTHKWPPISGWTFMYLNKFWRDANAPHVSYSCDFDWAIGGTWDEWLNVRNQETRVFAMQRYINSMRDCMVTLTKRA